MNRSVTPEERAELEAAGVTPIEQAARRRKQFADLIAALRDVPPAPTWTFEDQEKADRIHGYAFDRGVLVGASRLRDDLFRLIGEDLPFDSGAQKGGGK